MPEILANLARILLFQIYYGIILLELERINYMKNKICVYTCITGDYDELKDIKYVDKDYDYICFTNNKKIKSNLINLKQKQTFGKLFILKMMDLII